MSEKRTLGRFNSILLNVRTRTSVTFMESPEEIAARTTQKQTTRTAKAR